jgi:hypothetical protein
MFLRLYVKKWGRHLLCWIPCNFSNEVYYYFSQMKVLLISSSVCHIQQSRCLYTIGKGAGLEELHYHECLENISQLFVFTLQDHLFHNKLV